MQQPPSKEEYRSEEKRHRGLKKEDTPLSRGFQIYYNFVKPNQALYGQTPAQRSGIDVKGKNKWMTLIQNAKTSTNNC